MPDFVAIKKVIEKNQSLRDLKNLQKNQNNHKKNENRHVFYIL